MVATVSELLGAIAGCQALWLQILLGAMVLQILLAVV